MVNNLKQLTVCDKIILAAYKLHNSGKQSFSLEDLVVSAWENFPDTFGLKGHSGPNGKLCYPDSNRVSAEIMGSKPARKLGLIRKVGTKIYKLTEAGHARSLLLVQQRSSEKDVLKAGFSREVENYLKKLLSSRALEKFKNNRRDDITFYDACAFWGISPRSSAIELEGSFSNLEGIISSSMAALKGAALPSNMANSP